MSSVQEQLPSRENPPWAPWLCWGGLVIVGTLALVNPFWGRDRPEAHEEVSLQVAAGTKRASAIVGGRVDEFKDGLLFDWSLITPGYTFLLLAVFGFGALYLYLPVSRRLAVRALGATVVMAAADVAENVFLYRALNRLSDGDPAGHLQWAAYCALVKWALAIPLAACALWIAATLISRRFLGKARVKSAEKRRPRALVRSAYGMAKGTENGDDRPDIIAPPAAPHASTPLPDWSARPLPEKPDGSAKSRWRTRALLLPGREAAEVGICVSGGGIRSASVTLGALQALRERGVLDQARYLVSVSGGGYTAGAFQLALTEQQPEDRRGDPLARADLAEPEDAFAPGSPEEDHIRRHAKYLADGPLELLLTLGTVLRGLLVSLGMLTLAFAVAGLFLNCLYGLVPVTELEQFRPAEGKGIPGLKLYEHVWIPLLGVLGLAAAVSVVGAVLRAADGESRQEWVRSTVKALVVLALTIAAYTVVIPAVIWFFAWLAQVQPFLPEGDTGRSPVGVSLLGALAAAATAVASVFTAVHRQVKKVKPDGEKAGLFGGSGNVISFQGSGGWLKVIISWLTLFLVGFFGLALLAWTAVYADDWHRGWKVSLPVALLILPFVIDQTTFSLHPFYRRRLAGAFAVRRAVLKDTPEGSVGVLPYDYNAESTQLSTHAKQVDGSARRGRFPQVIFAASAAVSLRNRTAPGRPAVPFTFASDYIGGPDTGWVRTDTMEKTAHPLIRRDLTVQSAMAVSGAAFASAMGTQTMAFERLLALSNLRLGTWVPNPAYLAEVARHGPDWIMPRLPRVRRLRYQVQELVGRYSDTSPLLLCTDGGHFDNLGLVEMLRLRCRTIYVIDSSGDTPPLATTLAQAVTLAYEDLGVVIKFDQEEILRLVPGSAVPIRPEEPMSALNARLSASCVVTGDVTYPESIEFPDGEERFTEGKIIVVKANLTRDMDYELLSYALEEKVFPRQSTFDQWFDHAQFNAYRALGHHMSTAAVTYQRPCRAT
ncbi:patatin-like phospholipase family protein [Streptomyces sp. BA2]|uniref:patatin-like phospholipase family protein n=1 Tax=Streptomyces sp. BA2 TaxID=436595 RepID=UPI001321D555|nr:patatin-like phospholipase family protein [Streptomyces sp. BA2]MWA09340.1 hypothetical protein [Streptomyces sp. BA2]